jgi:hypothetical protein
MKRSRGILAVVAAGLLVLASVVGGVVLHANRLPDPATADRNGLLRWLVSCDLNQEPQATRRLLASRLEQEFSGGIDWQTVGTQLSLPQKRQVSDNVTVLLEPWVVEKSAQFADLPADKRPAFLDELLKQIDTWSGVEGFFPASEGSSSSANGTEGKGTRLFGNLMVRIGRLKQEVSPDEARQIDQLIQAIQIRWALRTLLGKTATPS